MKKITLAEAKTILRGHGMTLSKRDGEYRVNFGPDPGGGGAHSEETAYYTDNLFDAVMTGLHMNRGRPRGLRGADLAAFRRQAIRARALYRHMISDALPSTTSPVPHASCKTLRSPHQLSFRQPRPPALQNKQAVSLEKHED